MSGCGVSGYGMSDIRAPQAEPASITCVFQRTHSGEDSHRSNEQHEFGQYFHDFLVVAEDCRGFQIRWHCSDNGRPLARFHYGTLILVAVPSKL